LTPAELARRAAALYGPEWQSQMARRIRVDARTVRRWAAGDRTIPAWLAVILELLERHPRER
jgi:DNA-binding transcriptional regulator YiaG